MDTSSTEPTPAATPAAATTSKWTRKVTVITPPPASTLVVAEGGGSSDAVHNKKLYWDRSHYNSKGAQIRALHHSSTLYVGNLAFSTRTKQIRQHFAYLGPVKMVQMGLDRLKKTPCGFCFVEYEQRPHALAAVAHLSGTKLDGSIIRVELDAGFQPGRQYGRGASGGQVRHDRNKDQPHKRSREEAAAFGGSRDSTSSSTTGAGAAAVTTQDGHYGPDGGEGGGYEDDTMEPNAKRRRL
jgi:nuclear cap-binding protein subunit 2